MNSFDKFDHAYCDKVSNALWAAIEATSRDPLSGLSPIRNREAYSALINVMAMMLAQSDAPVSAIDQIAGTLSKTLIQRVGWARDAVRKNPVVGRNHFN